MTKIESEKVKKELAEKLRTAREKARLTQADVATAADMNVSYYAQMERGEVNPSIEIIEKVFKILKIKSLKIL